MTEPPAPRRRAWVEFALPALIVAGFTAGVAGAVAVDASFEHDEAVYAIQARAWAEAVPATGVEPHRAPLLPALGTPVALFTDRDVAFRAIGILAGVAAVVAVWALGRAVSGPAAGLIGAGAFASAGTVQMRAAQFLTDLLATALLLLLALILWRALEHPTAPRRSLVLAAPLAAAAFYARYGSALPIAILTATAVVSWWPQIRARPRPARQAAAFGAALLIPNVIASVAEFGTPWGIVTFTTERAGFDHVGQGLWQYVRWFPSTLAGPVAGAVMLVALAAAAVAVARRGPSDRALAFLVVPALGHIVAIGLAAHGEPRFVFFPIALLCVAGGSVIAPIARDRRGAVALAFVIAGGLVLGGQQAADRTERARASRAEVSLAGRMLRQALEPCVVYGIADAPLGWYSRCSAFVRPDARYAPPGARYLVVFERGAARAEGGLDPGARTQPSGEELRALLEGARRVAVIPDRGGRLGGAAIYLLPMLPSA